MSEVRFLLTGDTSLSVEFGNEISEDINAKIRAFNIALSQSGIKGIPMRQVLLACTGTVPHPAVLAVAPVVVHWQIFSRTVWNLADSPDEIARRVVPKALLRVS